MRSQEQAKSTMDMSEEILYGNLQEKMHMDMSEEPFCVEIYRKKGTGTGHRSHFVASGDHVLDGS